jgi:hypothetical protein
MPRLLRPYIPRAVRLKVAWRQLGSHVRAVFPGERTSVSQSLSIALKFLAYRYQCEVADLQLDHDPALENRQFNVRTQKYIPDANDPDHLAYRTKDAHRIKTLVRGDGAQLSDAAIARKRKRAERKAGRPKHVWPSRAFQKRKLVR